MISEKLKEFVEQYLESPSSSLVSALALVSTVWGIVAIYRDVYTWGGSRLASYAIAGLLGVCIIPFLLSVIVPSFGRQYAFPNAKRFIFTEINFTWEIDQSRNAIITNEKTYLFFAEPEKIDLTDRAFGSDPIKYHSLSYTSTDSTVTKQEQIKDNLQRVFWEPKNGEVKIGIPYTHHVKSTFPFSPGVPTEWKGMAIAIPVLSLRVNVSVNSKIPVRQAIVYKARRFQRIRNDEEIAETGRTVKRPMAPPPTITDQHTLSWSMEKALPGATYYFVIYF